MIDAENAGSMLTVREARKLGLVKTPEEQERHVEKGKDFLHSRIVDPIALALLTRMADSKGTGDISPQERKEQAQAQAHEAIGEAYAKALKNAPTASDEDVLGGAVDVLKEMNASKYGAKNRPVTSRAV